MRVHLVMATGLKLSGTPEQVDPLCSDLTACHTLFLPVAWHDQSNLIDSGYVVVPEIHGSVREKADRYIPHCVLLQYFKQVEEYLGIEVDLLDAALDVSHCVLVEVCILDHVKVKGLMGVVEVKLHIGW
jgi:hypothetical protein